MVDYCRAIDILLSLKFMETIVFDEDPSVFKEFIKNDSSISQSERLELIRFQHLFKSCWSKIGEYKNLLVFEDWILNNNTNNKQELIGEKISLKENKYDEPNCNLPLNICDGNYTTHKKRIKFSKINCNNKKNVIIHPTSGVIYEKVNCYDVKKEFKQNWKSIKVLPDGYCNPVILNNDININFERWNSASNSFEFQHKVGSLIQSYNGYVYKLKTTPSRIFQCASCFNCMSMIRYNVSYKDKFDSFMPPDHASFVYNTETSLFQKRKGMNARKYVIITIEEIGEHKSWLKPRKV